MGPRGHSTPTLPIPLYHSISLAPTLSFSLSLSPDSLSNSLRLPFSLNSPSPTIFILLPLSICTPTPPTLSDLLSYSVSFSHPPLFPHTRSLSTFSSTTLLLQLYHPLPMTRFHFPILSISLSPHSLPPPLSLNLLISHILFHPLSLPYPLTLIPFTLSLFHSSTLDRSLPTIPLSLLLSFALSLSLSILLPHSLSPTIPPHSQSPTGAFQLPLSLSPNLPLSRDFFF